MAQPNYASEKGTAAWADRFPQLAFTALGSTGLRVSQAGFGSYRIDAASPLHREALTLALQQGINLIDTSSNYGDGRSEQLIGDVLHELMAEGAIERNGVVVVTKAGYIQGQNLVQVQQRKAEGRPFPNVIHFDTGLSHCIHPDFLDDQLAQSLAHLRLDAVDGFLLHNPEYYLKWTRKAKIPLAEARPEYYRRIREAFAFLEEAVAQGRIQWYGVSSNTFPLPANHPEHTSLAQVWEQAAAVSPNHHFRLVQLPMNLFETGAITHANQPDGAHTLQFAAAKRLGVLVNRPLNALLNDRLIRLADVLPPSYPTNVEEVSTAVDRCLRLETDFRETWLPTFEVDEVDDETRTRMVQYLSVGTVLQGQWRGFGSYQNWQDVRAQFLLPRAQSALDFLSNRENLPAALISWLDAYVDAVNETFAAVSAFYQEQGHAVTQQIQETAVQADPDWDANTLSQTAVRALRSTNGISCVLVGMRQQRYVNDVLAELKRPVAQEQREEAWRKLQALRELHNA